MPSLYRTFLRSALVPALAFAPAASSWTIVAENQVNSYSVLYVRADLHCKHTLVRRCSDYKRAVS